MTYRTEWNGTPSERARSRISLSFAEAREMETGGDRRGNAEMLGFNQGTTLEISRVIFSARCKQSRRLWNPLDTSSFRALHATLFQIRLACTIGTISESLTGSLLMIIAKKRSSDNAFYSDVSFEVRGRE